MAEATTGSCAVAGISLGLEAALAAAHASAVVLLTVVVGGRAWLVVGLAGLAGAAAPPLTAAMRVE